MNRHNLPISVPVSKEPHLGLKCGLSGHDLPVRKALEEFMNQQIQSNKFLRGKIHVHDDRIGYLCHQIDHMVFAMQNLTKHSKMIETQVHQIARTQSLILEQLKRKLTLNLLR